VINAVSQNRDLAMTAPKPATLRLSEEAEANHTPGFLLARVLIYSLVKIQRSPETIFRHKAMMTHRQAALPDASRQDRQRR
jgi:hypothetical protein